MINKEVQPLVPKSVFEIKYGDFIFEGEQEPFTFRGLQWAESGGNIKTRLRSYDQFQMPWFWGLKKQEIPGPQR